MCDECYDADVEHYDHWNRPLEDCDEKDYNKLYAFFKGEPEYACNYCLGLAHRGVEK